MQCLYVKLAAYISTCIFNEGSISICECWKLRECTLTQMSMNM